MLDCNRADDWNTMMAHLRWTTQFKDDQIMWGSTKTVCGMQNGANMTDENHAKDQTKKIVIRSRIEGLSRRDIVSTSLHRVETAHFVVWQVIVSSVNLGLVRIRVAQHSPLHHGLFTTRLLLRSVTATLMTGQHICGRAGRGDSLLTVTVHMAVRCACDDFAFRVSMREN